MTKADGRFALSLDSKVGFFSGLWWPIPAYLWISVSFGLLLRAGLNGTDSPVTLMDDLIRPWGGINFWINIFQ